MEATQRMTQVKALATLTRTGVEAGAILLRTAVKVVWSRMGGGGWSKGGMESHDDGTKTESDLDELG